MTRYFFFPFLMVAALGLAFTRNYAPEETAATGAPFAVAELFTSQGCSSCPPADRVLAELRDRAARTGEPIHVFSFHVDYWNYLGWADPFSSPHFSARQTDYTDRLEVRTYTPQLVINGQTELIGSRSEQVTAAIDAALARPAKDYGLEVSAVRLGDTVRVTYSLSEPAPHLRAVALLVDERAESEVTRGENRGRKLVHVNVVRDMAVAETRDVTRDVVRAVETQNFASLQPGVIELTVPKDASPHLSVAVLLQADDLSIHSIQSRVVVQVP